MLDEKYLNSEGSIWTEDYLSNPKAVEDLLEYEKWKASSINENLSTMTEVDEDDIDHLKKVKKFINSKIESLESSEMKSKFEPLNDFIETRLRGMMNIGRFDNEDVFFLYLRRNTPSEK